jgi:hypothetical protein
MVNQRAMGQDAMGVSPRKKWLRRMAIVFFLLGGALGSFWLGRQSREMELARENRVPVLAIAAPIASPVVEQAIVRPPVPQPAADPEKPDPTKVAAQLGKLRIRNRSSHPVRLALLFQTALRPSQTPVNRLAQPSMSYQAPAHWDFAPQEGQDQGLLLGLPNRNTELQTGDVIVAFAQDGSQRYWGPFVVGETRSPLWNAQQGEWQLSLEHQ